MEDKIFRATLSNIGEHEIKFLPNINNIKKNSIEFKTFFNNNTKQWHYRSISYALINGNIKIFVYNHVAFMNKIKLLSDYDKLVHKIYDLNSPSFFKVKISDEQGFVNIDVINDEKEEYVFGKTDDSKKYLLKLYDEIKHIKLEDVMYLDMYNLSSNKIYFNSFNKTMYDIYKEQYPEFENIYKSFLKKKKLNRIKSML